MQRLRLAKVVDLARVYQACGVEELAKELGRDPTRLVSETGNPKADLVMNLSRLLEWPTEDVVRAIRGKRESRGTALTAHCTGTVELDDSGFEELDGRARSAHRDGNWKEMLGLSAAMLEKSSTPEERATAFCRMGCPFDSMGRYTSALEAWQSGLQEPGTSDSIRLMLKTNLANAHYTLWNLVEAHALASEVLERIKERQFNSRTARALSGMAGYVRASSRRRLICKDMHSLDEHCEQARRDLTSSEAVFNALSREHDDDSYRSIARTCRGAALEIDAACHHIKPLDALDRLEDGLSGGWEKTARATGDHLESFGWWAIFGANIALRHLPARKCLERLPIFQKHLLEASTRLGNLAFRAKWFSIELERRERIGACGRNSGEWKLGPAEIQDLTDLMGMIPAFQATGWRILTEYGALEQAKCIDPRTWRKGLVKR